MAETKANYFTLTPINFKEKRVIPENKSPNEIERFDPLIFCRTCANMDSCLVPIFKEEGLEYCLNEKIEKYLPIQVSEKDDLPTQLCYQCASTLIAWDSLVISCVEAEKKLRLLKQSFEDKQCEEIMESDNTLVNDNMDSDDEPLITKIGSARKDKNNEKVHSQDKIDVQVLNPLEISSGRSTPASDSNKAYDNTTEDSENTEKESSQNVKKCSEDWKAIPDAWKKVISCKDCGKICCAPKHLRQHERRGTCKRNFQCKECGQVFLKELYYLRHVKKHKKESTEEEPTKGFRCSICSRRFKFEDNGLAHEKICGKPEPLHKCSVCGKRFETKGLAEQHWTSHHKSCVCHFCGQLFNKPESLKQHLKTVHEDFKMVCHFCGKEFSRKARLQEHLQHHTGQMDFTCHVCGKGSTNAYSFGVHLATHSKETPFTCSFCPRTFKHMKYVYLHERSVHLKLKSGKTYVKPKKPGKNALQRTCPLCNKTFKRESAMQIHKRSVHEGKNGYICKLCGKDFKYTYLLYVHKKKHHFPEKCKYICEFCEKPFPVKTELQNHMRKHTGEKPYVCSICGKTYSFHGSLNMHMKTRHENKKNFQCNICGTSYNFQSHLARHMSVHEKLPEVVETEVCQN